MRDKLRKSVFALSSTVCVLAVVFWARSRTWRDNFKLKLAADRFFEVESAVGQVLVANFPVDSETSDKWPRVDLYQFPTAFDPCHPADNTIGFNAEIGSYFQKVVVP